MLFPPPAKQKFPRHARQLFIFSHSFSLSFFSVGQCGGFFGSWAKFAPLCRLRGKTNEMSESRRDAELCLLFSSPIEKALSAERIVACKDFRLSDAKFA